MYGIKGIMIVLQQPFNINTKQELMKNIPIWQPKLKTLQSKQQPTLSTSPLPACQLHAVHIDQVYQIYTTNPNPSNEHTSPHNNSTGYNSVGKNSSCNVNISMNVNLDGEYGDTKICSLVHDRKYGRLVWVQFLVYACVVVDDLYCLFVEDLAGRYCVVRVQHADLVDTVKAIAKRINAQSIDISAADIFDNKQAQNTLNTSIKPLRKLNAHISVHAGNIYLAGCHPIHPWELTSPLWVYSCADDQWQQIEIKKDRKSITLSNSAADISSNWIFAMEGMLIYVSNHYVRVQSINGEYNKQIQLTTDKQPIINTHTDSYLTCTYKHNNTGQTNLLILVQTKSSTRSPLLLEISLLVGGKSKGKMVEDGKFQKKMKNSVNIDRNDRNGIDVQVVRYDLGVFLGEGGQSSYGYDRSQKLNTSATSITGDIGIINQIVYMQVSDQGSTSIMHTMSTTSHSNFIKKSQPQPTKAHKKVQILTLYTKTRKNSQNPNNPYIQLNTYSIKLSNLQKVQLNSPNKPLSFYFQKKQYCDLIFLAQKRQVLCNRQLFQFYSSKFKKLYSNSSNSRTESQQQPQTLVKLDNTKLSTIYFLVQHLYHNFGISLKGFDQVMLIDLMILSHKFQIIQMQVLCQQEVQISCENFNKLYDYFRNSETHRFREQFLKFFIIHAQDVMKIMPIGKVQQLIRLVYSPECTHTNHTEIKSKLQNNYSVKDSQTGQTKQFHKSINYANIIKSQQVILKICLKCSRLLTFNHETHRKNKSSVRGTSLGSFGHKKKDNKSN